MRLGGDEPAAFSYISDPTPDLRYLNLVLFERVGIDDRCIDAAQIEQRIQIFRRAPVTIGSTCKFGPSSTTRAISAARRRGAPSIKPPARPTVQALIFSFAQTANVDARSSPSPRRLPVQETQKQNRRTDCAIRSQPGLRISDLLSRGWILSWRFEQWLISVGITAWPRLNSGALQLDGDTFRMMYGAHPAIEGLHALRDSLGVIVRARIRSVPMVATVRACFRSAPRRGATPRQRACSMPTPVCVHS